MFCGRVEDFGETSIKISNPDTGRSKRIAYYCVMEYELLDAESASVRGMKIDSETKMVEIPDMEACIGVTQVTQRFYEKVMGENPSWFQLSNDRLDDYEVEALEKDGCTDNYPVENISWFDALYFCNKLSLEEGLTPAYSVDGETDPECWGYTPHQGEVIGSEVQFDFSANGYRLPTDEEWMVAASKNIDKAYSDSDNLDEVGWYADNSGEVTHPVAQKMPNGYGLYDMIGNVEEWVWNTFDDDRGECCSRGGSFYDYAKECNVMLCGHIGMKNLSRNYLGLRLARLLSDK
jgi:formylglycine-generating enzyme required for sulfatase activity